MDASSDDVTPAEILELWERWHERLNDKWRSQFLASPEVIALV